MDIYGGPVRLGEQRTQYATSHSTRPAMSWLLRKPYIHLAPLGCCCNRPDSAPLLAASRRFWARLLLVCALCVVPAFSPALPSPGLQVFSLSLPPQRLNRDVVYPCNCM